MSVTHRFSSRTAALMMLLAVLSVGCHHRAVAVPTPTLLSEHYCWWAVLRSPLPPDSVAARFQGAFRAVDLTGITQVRRADTVWVCAGPTEAGSTMPAGPAGPTYASRAVAYWHGDSTHYRYYVAIAPPPYGWGQPAHSGTTWPRQMDLCAAIARSAAIPGTAPRNPTGEESLSVWRRRP